MRIYEERISKLPQHTTRRSSNIHIRFFLIQFRANLFSFFPTTSMYSPGTVGVPYNAQQQVPLTPWTTKLCNCTGNCNNCCLTCCCPAIAFGQIAEIIDTGSTTCWCNGLVYTLLCCCTPCYSYSYRTKLRAKFNLVEEPCGDCLVHCFCERCALCQEYREIKNRGLDPALGWAVNMEKNMRATQSGMPRTVPPMVQGMWQ